MGAVSSRREVLVAVGAASVSGLSGCTAGGGGGEEREGRDERASDETTVRMTADHTFAPERVEIDVGETVVWENDAPPRQSVTAYEEEIPELSEYFASGGSGREVIARILYPYVGGLNRGDRYRNTFEVAGTYRYFSIPSEGRGMKGTVVVTE